MEKFKDILSGPDGQSAIDEYFATQRSSLVEGAAESAGPDIADFLRDRGVDVPTTGTLSVLFTEATPGVTPMRPVPDCPGGYCVPEQCPDGTWKCGWVCYCP